MQNFKAQLYQKVQTICQKIFEYAGNQNREQIKASRELDNQIFGFGFHYPPYKRVILTVLISQTARNFSWVLMGHLKKYFSAVFRLSV